MLLLTISNPAVAATIVFQEDGILGGTISNKPRCKVKINDDYLVKYISADKPNPDWLWRYGGKDARIVISTDPYIPMILLDNWGKTRPFLRCMKAVKEDIAQ